MKSIFADGALLVLPGLIWGASFLFIAEGLTAVAPNGVTFARVAIGFLTLSLIPAARGRLAPADRAWTAALGVVWMALPLSMFPFAEQHVSSAFTGMLNGATPLFVAAVASMLARRLPDRSMLAGLGVGFGGAVVMTLPGLGGSNSTWGVLLIVLALASYGLALNLARPLQAFACWARRSSAVRKCCACSGARSCLTLSRGLVNGNSVSGTGETAAARDTDGRRAWP
jgi:drug/metabolite transporter (DMT)-like permease